MSRPALSPTSYVVLGTVALLGPSTPYDIKQAVTAGVGYFWSFPHSQIYSEPQRLADAGLLAEEREDDGRRRRIFSLTRDGRRELKDWLGDPTSQLPEIRDIALLKLWFGDLVKQGQIVALATQQAAAHRDRRAVYEAIAAASAGQPGAANTTVRLGLAWEKAAAAFWDSIVADPPAV